MNQDRRVPGFDAPAASFEVPLEMLAACHGRIEKQCATLRRLVPHVRQHGSDAQARTAAANLLRYFDTSALHHHRDEEVDLFPELLEAMAGSDAVCIREMTVRLRREHDELEAAWAGLRPVLERIARGEPVAATARQIEDFAGAYQRHLEYENAELLPMAARLLSDAQIERIGRAMRERRGVRDSDL